jgi:hypothetical protein
MFRGHTVHTIFVNYMYLHDFWVRVMMFNATFNNISFILYCGSKFYWWRKPKYPEKTTHDF